MISLFSLSKSVEKTHPLSIFIHCFKPIRLEAIPNRVYGLFEYIFLCSIAFWTSQEASHS